VDECKPLPGGAGARRVARIGGDVNVNDGVNDDDARHARCANIEAAAAVVAGGGAGGGEYGSVGNRYSYNNVCQHRWVR
jgi:hypothetical protein